MRPDACGICLLKQTASGAQSVTSPSKIEGFREFEADLSALFMQINMIDTGRSNFTNLKAIGSYSGNVAYCIEPGISLKVGQTMNKYDENYFNNLAANGVISGDEIRLFVGRILQYGYRGTISTSWRSQNEAAANSIAQAYAKIGRASCRERV